MDNLTSTAIGIDLGTTNSCVAVWKKLWKKFGKKDPGCGGRSGLWRFSHPPFAQGESSLRYPIGPKAVGIRGRIISESGFGLRCTGFPNG